tara:strand:+ start:2968 stop:4608 length:1641 start_codon:yes stop_codon:yes gene_type:complete
MKSNIFFENRIYFFLFFAYFFIGLLLVNDYGISVDEEFHRYSGFYWLNYILEFTELKNLKFAVSSKLEDIRGHTLPNPKDFPFYGVTFDVPLAFLETIFQIDHSKNYYLFRHYANFIIFYLSSVFFFLILKNRFKSQRIILLGVLLYISSPRIFGDSFYNNKDIIFLSLMTINLYFFFRAIDNSNFKNIFFLSLFSALTCATRILGVFIPIIFIILFFLSKKTKDNCFYKDLKVIIIYLILFFLFLIFLWPYLWQSPYTNLIYSFKIFSKYPAEFQMLFKGDYVDSKFLPLDYVPLWIAITLPISTLLIFIFGYLNLFKRFFARLIDIKEKNNFNDFWRGNSEKKDFLVFVCFSLIFFYIILSNTDLYNGWRHLYFLHLFIIYIACCGLYRATIILKNKNLFFIITLVLITFNFVEILRFHPFQGSYFNQLVLKKNKNKFEVDYWGLAGVKFLHQVRSLERQKENLIIGVASYLPLERSLKMLEAEKINKIKIVGQDYDKADYIFNNNISEVNKNISDKYNIPRNFELIDEFFVNGFMVYEIYRKQ